jgi:hypothetical protein
MNALISYVTARPARPHRPVLDFRQQTQPNCKTNLSQTAMSTPTSSKIKEPARKLERSKSLGTKGKKASEFSSSITFGFPATAGDPTAALAPLKDESSAYALVAKTCLQICQYAGNGSSAHVEETGSVASSALFHDPSYANVISTSFAALVGCIHEHKDRRCRILACKTLAILARSSYARIRHSPLIFAMRQPTIGRLEDEVGSDVPTALATAALEDPDDGVSASAVEALAILTLSNSATAGTLVEDELLREIQAIALCRVSPYAPTLRAVVDEDPSIPQAELQTRIYENVLSPRLLQLIDRIVQYPNTAHVALALPLLTSCLVYQIKTTPGLAAGMDRSTYSKRWSELNVQGLADTVVQCLILPSLSQHVDGCLATTAAMSALRLAHACPAASWATDAARWAVMALQLDCLVDCLEQRLASLAATVIALRAIPLPERTELLLLLAEHVCKLPATTSAPVGISCAGLLLEWQGLKEYRRPARIGLLTEIALSFFLDGPVGAGADTGRRADCVKSFLSSELVSNINAEKESSLSLRADVLLVFTTVAVDTGRRFLVGADGNVQVTDPRSPAVDEWVNLVWVVLSSFASCVLLGRSPVYLEEDLSMTTAGLASYILLLQEYLHMVGLLRTSCSVAVKLTTNACPPHILWDRMTESAVLLAKFETVNMGQLEQTTKLMDELVAYEKKHGIPSHHMRLFVLALAADHWVQGRITAIESHVDPSSKMGLNVQSGRDIILALDPKRLLGKIFEAHVAQANSNRRDPIKKLALETVRMCVACIENIALSAINWRRRFGSSEPKKLVSGAVGILQGKSDEPTDDNIRAVMGPLCEAAVRRIQTYYESEGTDQDFQFSELVAQPGKTKIKPLISSTRPPPCPKDVYMRAYLMQLSREIVSCRAQQAVLSSPPADSLQSAACPANWLRLAVPPVPESRDGRILGNYGKPLAAWGNSVISASAASDAVQIIIAHTPSRHLRYDGEDEFCVTVSMRVFNMTAVDFPEGLRLELGVSRRELDLEEETAIRYAESLGITATSLMSEVPMVSSAVVYRNEVKSGEYLTWVVDLGDFTKSSVYDILPSIVYRNVRVEPGDVGSKWVGETGGGGEASTAGGESKSGEDDFQVTNTSIGGKSAKGEEQESENIRAAGEPLRLSPLLGFQPCPLVFFRDRWGDTETFRFLWFRMPFHLAPVKVDLPPTPTSGPTPDPTSQRIASMSMLRWSGEAIPGGFAAKAWAFSSFSGRRILCIFAESDGEASSSQHALHFRGECELSLFGLAGSEAARCAVVAAVLPGMIPVT